MYKIIGEWSLPKGDVYEVRQSCSKDMLAFHSYIRREKETTLCCHGTNSMATIRQYYMHVKLAQQDVMDNRTNAKLHAYWVAYRSRRLAQCNSQTSSLSCNAHTSSHISRTSAQTTGSRHVKESHATGKRVSFLC